MNYLSCKKQSHEINFVTTLLSSSQRGQESRLVIGCVDYEGRETRGSWKHQKAGSN